MGRGAWWLVLAARYLAAGVRDNAFGRGECSRVDEAGGRISLAWLVIMSSGVVWDGMPVTVAFLPLDSELASSHWANRAAACVSQSDLIHCELILPRGAGAFSIVAGGRVFMHAGKTFSRKDWRFVSVTTSPAQDAALLAFCGAHVGEPFNALGYYLTPFGGWAGGGKAWYCSEVCTAALLAAGVPLDVVPHKTTPGSLMGALSACNAAVKTAHPTRALDLTFE